MYCYNWAVDNPDKVSCIYGDAPVCDLKSWPLGEGKGAGSPNDIPKLLKAFDAANETELLSKAINPIDQLEPLAKVKVPILHVYGDADTLVPWDENTGILSERYRALGGDITLIAKPGIGQVHGLDDSTPSIEFICRRSVSASSNRSEPIFIGSRRELFVERFLNESMTNARPCELDQSCKAFKNWPESNGWSFAGRPFVTSSLDSSPQNALSSTLGLASGAIVPWAGWQSPQAETERHRVTRLSPVASWWQF